MLDLHADIKAAVAVPLDGRPSSTIKHSVRGQLTKVSIPVINERAVAEASLVCRLEH